MYKSRYIPVSEFDTKNGEEKMQKKRRMKKVRKAAGYAMIAAVFLLLLWFIRDLKPYVVLSGSMEPAMPVGSLAIADSSKTQVSAGDVAAFVRNGQTVTHRIIRVTDDGYITKGDANENADTGVIQSQDILGTVICCIPYLGYGVMWLQEYRILVLGCVVLLLIFALLFTGKEKKSGKQRKDPLRTEKAEKGELKL
mgnify:FL=1